MLLELDIAAIPAADIPAALAQLAAWQSQLAARLMTAPAPEAAADEPDRMLTPREAAELLRRSTKWISRHRRSLPFGRRLGPRSWVYSELGLRKWLARQRA
jgi:hypothetical protein